MVGKLWIWVLFVGMLAAGTVNTLTAKFQFESCAKSLVGHTSTDASGRPNCPPGEEKFTKTWGQTMMMFFGEALVLTLLCRKQPKHHADPNPGATPPKTVSFTIFALPAACDVLGTGIGAIGLLYVPASVWQMMRGSVVVFSTFFSVVLLNRTLSPHHWVGVLVTVTGITLVGSAAMINDSGSTRINSSSDTLKGIGLVVLSQVFNAFQYVTEEMYVKKHKIPPARVVGTEGIWGLLYMMIILVFLQNIPGTDNGDHWENTVDTVYKLVQSPMPLDVWCGVYMFSIANYNFFGVTMAGQLSAVQRMMVDAMRTAMVWIVEVLVFYITIHSACSLEGQAEGRCFGTKLGPGTPLQLVGFVFLVVGTLTYNGMIKLPCCPRLPSSRKGPIMASSPLRMLFSPVAWLTSPRTTPSPGSHPLLPTEEDEIITEIVMHDVISGHCLKESGRK